MSKTPEGITDLHDMSAGAVDDDAAPDFDLIWHGIANGHYVNDPQDLRTEVERQIARHGQLDTLIAIYNAASIRERRGDRLAFYARLGARRR